MAMAARRCGGRSRRREVGASGLECCLALGAVLARRRHDPCSQFMREFLVRELSEQPLEIGGMDFIDSRPQGCNSFPDPK
jgi:hypothetical protein